MNYEIYEAKSINVQNKDVGDGLYTFLCRDAS